MAETSELVAVGWCHGCGTLQLRSEMPTEWTEWSQQLESVCVTGDGEPWGLGVWNKGEHAADCPVVATARAREVDWQPTLDECICGGADEDWDDES